MLVLSRRPTERILIGNDIIITVVRCTSEKVRLGIDAPREVTVIREEIEREVEQKQQADAGSVSDPEGPFRR